MTSPLVRFRDFIAAQKHSKIIRFFAILIIAVVIPLTVLVTQNHPKKVYAQTTYTYKCVTSNICDAHGTIALGSCPAGLVYCKYESSIVPTVTQANACLDKISGLYVGGAYCKNNVLYNCNGKGGLVAILACTNGCQVNPIGQVDSCKPTLAYTCPYSCQTSALCGAEGTSVSGYTCATGKVCCNFKAPTPTPTTKPTVACTSGTKQCSSTGVPQVCNSSGVWINGLACTSGYTCSVGSCKAPCSTIPGGICVPNAQCKQGYGLAGGQCSSSTTQVCCDSIGVINSPTPVPTPVPTSAPISAPICEKAGGRCFSTTVFPQGECTTVIPNTDCPTGNYCCKVVLTPTPTLTPIPTTIPIPTNFNACYANADACGKKLYQNDFAYDARHNTSYTVTKVINGKTHTYKYAKFIQPSAPNFGDAYCALGSSNPQAFSINKLSALIRQLDPSHYNLWWNVILPGESSFDPNNFSAHSTSGRGAYGLFQANPNYCGSTYDSGNVNWIRQTTNAINLRKNRGWCYWGVATCAMCSRHC